MRVAVFTETFYPKVDGIVVKVGRLLDHLALRGHQSILFAPKSAPMRYNKTPVISLPALPMPFYPEVKLASPLSFVDAPLTRFKPDLIHLVNPTSLGLAGLRSAKRHNIPVLASYHTDVPGFAENWNLGFLSETLYRYFRWIHNKVDLNVCPSEFTRHQLLEHGFERVAVWRGGVDTNLYSPAKKSRDWRARLTCGHPDRPLMIYTGRVAPEKRIDRLLDVVKALPEVSLAIIGDGPARRDLEKIFAGTHTHFTGYITGEDLAAAYASADMFAFTGDKETFGNVVVEAMASGLPVVAPNSGGVTDLVIHNRNGFLYPPGDSKALVGYVRQLVENSNLAEKFGKEGCRLAEKRTWEVTLDELMGHYETVLEMRKGGIFPIEDSGEQELRL